MNNDLNDIVRRRNAKLQRAQRPRTVRQMRKVDIDRKLSEALGVAPKYVIDAVTRAIAIGRRT